MKAQDFRLGNLVMYEGKVYEIDSISKEFPTLNTPEFGIGVVDWNNIQPIPLTQEWIANFGFKKRITIGHSVQYFIGENPITRDWLFDMLWLKGNDYPFYRNGYFKLEHVHQLQNLFYSLTNEELTIKP